MAAVLVDSAVKYFMILIEDRAQIANRYIENLYITISPFTEMLDTDILACCSGMPSTSTSVLSAFSFSLCVCVSE